MSAVTARGGEAIKVGGGYAWYALMVMALVYVLNFIDRQILSILAEDIKADLHLTDAQLGFLYGTAFAIFYTVFGIPLGRLADSWYRGRLMALGLAIWSSMTALSGFAGSFTQLAIARVGVGVGEASASPAAFSMLADYFPDKRRALALSIYSAGLYLGMGLSLPLGGSIASAWNRAWPDGGAPLGLAGWQAAFLSVGLPGLLLALWVLTLKEPMRGTADGRPEPVARPGAWKEFAAELAAIMPPLTIFSVARYRGALPVNLAAAVGLAAAAWILVRLTGDSPQWIAYAVGVYAVFSWTQTLRVKDPPTYRLIWGTPMVLVAILGFGSLSYFTYSYSFWVAPFAIRTLGVSKEMAGLYLGIPGAFASAAGVILGGRLSDAWKARDARGRIFVCMLAVILPAPFVLWMFASTTFASYATLSPIVYLLNSMWVGSAVAAYQDFVLPRMRGVIGATYLLGATMVGLALGPYVTGKVATVTGSLQTGVYSLYAVAPVTLILLWLVGTKAAWIETTKEERARDAGEPDEGPLAAVAPIP
jgi:MFS family permease